MPLRKLHLWKAHAGAGWSCLAERRPHGSLFSIRTCEPVRDPHWSSLLLKDCTPWKGPKLDQFVESCCPWEESTLVNYMQDCLHRWLSMLEQKSMRRQLVISWPQPPLPIPACCSRRGGREIVSEFDHRKTRGVGDGIICFNFCCCFSLSYSIFNGKKKIKLILPKWILFFLWRQLMSDLVFIPTHKFFHLISSSCPVEEGEWESAKIRAWQTAKVKPTTRDYTFILIFLALFFKRVLISRKKKNPYFFIYWSSHAVFQAHFSTLIAAAQNTLSILAQNRPITYPIYE